MIIRRDNRVGVLDVVTISSSPACIKRWQR